MDDQLEEVADMFITPLLDVPSKFNGYDAYTRQSNVLISAFEKLVDEYRRAHSEWKHEGGKSPRSCTHKGITSEQGKTDEQALRMAWDTVVQKYA